MVILRDPTGGEGGGDADAARTEKIVLKVVCPPQDFATTGGIKDGIDALNLLNATFERTRSNLQKGFSIGGSSSGSVSSSGEIRLNISGSAIQASLVAGEKIKLNLSASDFELIGSGRPPSTPSSVPPGVGGVPSPPSGGSGRILSQVTSETTEGGRLQRRRYAAGNFDRSFHEVVYDKEGRPTGATLHEQFAAEGTSDVANTILEKKNDLQQKILQGVLTEAKAHKILAATMDEEAQESEELNALQKSRYAVAADALRLRAGRIENRTANRAQVGMFRDYISEQDETQSQAEEQASRNIQARRLRRQRTESRSAGETERNIEEINRAYSTVKAQARIDLASAYDRTRGMTPLEARRAGREADVRYHETLHGAAHDIYTATSGVAGYEKPNAEALQNISTHYHAGAAATASLRLETDRLNESTRLIGKNMIQAVKQMALWGSAAGVLYGSLSMLRRALEENVQITSEMAILSVTFKDGAAAASTLTDKVIHLAAVNGQFAGEAVESATEWSRVYSTQKDIIDATNASLVLANISGRNSAETTQFLSAMTETYQLRAQELNGVIGEMAAISQTANVSTEGLMKGMESVGEAAKVAGLSYSQTMGLITGGVMATQQSGTSVANTIKTLVTQVGNPETQGKLRFGYGIEVTGPGGELKQMPQILREVYAAWERMTEAERRSLLFNVGGRQNTARLAGVLDDFVQGQLKAAQGQLHLNAAEVENEAILGTLRAQWQGLASEFGRFVNQQGSGVVKVLRDITHSIRDVLSALNTPVGGTLTSVVGALGVAGMARMMISGYSLEKQGTLAAGTKGGLLVSTARAVQGDVAALGNAFNATAAVGANRLNWAFEKIGVGSVVASDKIGAATLASRGLLATFVALTDVILPLAAALGLLYTFRKASDYSSGADQLLLRQRDAQLAQGRMQGVSTMRSMLQTDINIVGQPGVPRDRLRGVARDMAQAELPFGTPAEVENLAKQNELLVAQGRDTELIAQAKLRMAQLDRDYTGNLEASKVEYKEIIRMAEKQIAIEQIRQSFQKNNSFGGTIDRAIHDPEVEISTAKATIQEARQALAALKAAAQEEADLANGSWVTREAQTRFVGAMRQETFGSMGRQYGLLPTASPLDSLNRQIAELTSQRIYLDAEHAAITSMPGGSPGSPDQEQKMRLLRESEEKRAQNMADLRAAQSPEISSATRNEARLSIYSRMARAEWAGFARSPTRGDLLEHPNLTAGLTEGGQLVNQSILGKGRLQELRYETQTRQGSDGEMRQRNAEILQLEIGLMENKMTAQLKIIELTKEEINLNAQARREYERSLLTSSPSELLRKAATMRLTHGQSIGGPGGISGGEFFALSQESREDLLRMPGNTDAERQARRSRGALERYFGRASAFDLGEQAVGGAISASRYGSLVSAPSPQFSIPEGAIAAVMTLGAESAAAAMHIATLTQHVSQLGDALAHILSHGGQTHSAPSIAQSIPNWTQR
ncbi:MAG TPA: phage tail tape measure protein [Verrucomicrobiae bacterium]|jgi:TP901 family phage tail tape measure protein|nr:phage tail tape measure protein [Verrucomicrobiae bacterium]